MARECKVNAKVFSKVVDAMEKSEPLHPSVVEEESFELFKVLKLQSKEEQIQERGVGEPALRTTPEFTLHGVPDALKTSKVKVEASTAQEYDPNKDERTFGCCMKTFLCLCFCSC